MNVYKIFLSVIAIIVLSLSLSNAMSDEEIAEYKKTVWTIELELDMPELIPAAVIWAVFDEDPRPEYKHRLEKLKDPYSQALEGIEDAEQIFFWKRGQMCASWNLGFREITGDKVYLLTKVPENGIQYSLASTSNPGKKWIVSKYVHIDDKPVCWVIPVEVEIGKTIEIVFSEDNLYDISEIYNEVMGE